jgi:hypothetical protein
MACRRSTADRDLRLDRAGHWTTVTWNHDGIVHNDCHRNGQHLGVFFHADRDSEPVGSRRGSGSYQHVGKYLIVRIAVPVCRSEHADGIVYGIMLGTSRRGARGRDIDFVRAKKTRRRERLSSQLQKSKAPLVRRGSVKLPVGTLLAKLSSGVHR